MSGTEKAFSRSAASYDDTFTRTEIGRLQRNRVWNYINQSIRPEEYPSVLELNCGTGEDALWLVSKGFKVTATDLSEGMIAVAEEKKSSLPAHNQLRFEVCSFADIAQHFPPSGFNFIFSNFGGLNCIPEAQLKKVLEDVSLLLKPGGRFIAVIMSDDCAWEKFYFHRKKMYAEAERRKQRSGVHTVIEREEFTTWYYSPDQIRNWSAKHFNTKHIRAVGWTIPPSYTEKFFATKPGLLKALRLAEEVMGNNTTTARKADHFLIDLEKKNI